MGEKVKLSKDGTAIDFVTSDNIPTSVKKFRQSPEIEGFYRFIFENDLQKEAYEILNRIIENRKNKKAIDKKAAKEAARMEKVVATDNIKKIKTIQKPTEPMKTSKPAAKALASSAKAVVKTAAAKTISKITAKPAAKTKKPTPKAKIPATKKPKKK